MASQFDVDFGTLIENLAKIQAGFRSLGERADDAERKLANSSASTAKLLKDVETYTNKVRDSAEAAGVSVSSLNKIVGGVEAGVLVALSKINQQNLQATISTKAYTGELKDLERILKDTDSKNTFLKWARKSANLSNEMAGQTKHLSQAVAAHYSVEGRRVAALKETLASLQRMNGAEAKQRQGKAELTQKLKLLNTETGRGNEVLKAHANVLTRTYQEEVKLGGKLKEVQRAYEGNTGAIQTQIDRQSQLNANRKQANTDTERQTGTLEALQRTLTNLDTVLGKTIAVMQVQAKAATDAVQQDSRWAAQLQALNRTLASLNEGGLAATIAKTKEVVKNKAASVTATERERGAYQALLQQIQSLQSGLGSMNAQMAAHVSVLTKAAQEQILYDGKVAATQRSIEALTKGEREHLAILKEVERGMLQSATATEREKNAVAELERQIQSLNGGLGGQIIRLKEQKKALEDVIKAEMHQTTVVAELTAAEARLIATNERALSALKAKNRATQEAANAQQLMTTGEAKAQAQAEATAAAVKRHSDALLDEARKAHGMSTAQKELTANREKEEAKLAQLRAQRSLLNSTYGQEIALVKKQIAEQTLYNKKLTMTTMELLGFARAQNQANMAMVVGSQSAAMLRAGLTGLHTSIGMYTSATILAASATYAIAAALRSSVTAGMEFEATMSRAMAIMGTSAPSWQGDTGQVAAMEEQVRALGQTTVFTASEVAQGLTELGMAGLSAGEAMIALQPALDLAQVAQVSMSQSADMSTNIMMTFGKNAAELGHVVDVMATAVTNSNTTFEQLAHALTYAGPAAHAAGISMEDTTAAVEALANSGVKASRAGTALRRLFVNILNPTAKGTEMMAKYGISVLDAEGNTKGLVDIVGQLSDKLGNLTGAEKLSAIQNLVGVYATSSIAALVDQAKKLKELRRGLEDVDGATKRMKKTMEDNLKTDWKSVLSSYEEVQISAFKSQSMRLREASAQLSKTLIDLTKPIKEGSDITELDIIIQKAETTAKTLGYVVTGFLAFKAAGAASTFAAGLSADMVGASSSAGILQGRLLAAGTSMQTMSLSSARASVALSLQAAKTSVLGTVNRLIHAPLATTGSLMIGLAAAAYKTATALTAVAAGAARLLGWVGLIWGIYEAAKMAFGSDAEKDLENRKGNIDQLTASYRGLRGSIEAAGIARSRAALEDLNKADRAAISTGYIRDDGTEVASLESKAESIRAALAKLSPTDAARKAMSEYLESTVLQITKLEEGIANRIKILGKMATTQETVTTTNEKLLKSIESVSAAEAHLRDVQSSVDRRSQVGFTGPGLAKVALAKEALEVAKKEKDAVAALLKDEKARVFSMRDQAKLAQNLSKEEFGQALADKRATAAEKYVKNQEKILAIDKQLAELHDRNDAAQKAASEGVEISAEGQDVLNRLLDQQNDLREKQVDLHLEVAATYQTLLETQEAAWVSSATEEEKLIKVQQALSRVAIERQLNQHLIDTQNKSQPEYYEEENRLLLQQLGLLSERGALLNAAFSRSKALADSERGLWELDATDSEKLVRVSSELNEILAQRAVLTKPAKETDDGYAAWQEEQTRLNNEEKRLRESQKQIESSIQRANKPKKETKAKKTDADKDLEAARSMYESLRKEYDAVGVSAAELAVKTGQLDLLIASGNLTAEERAKALEQLKKSHYELTLAQDKNYQSLDKLRDSYSQSPFSGTLEDLAELNRLLEDGAVSMEEHARIANEIRTTRKESVLNGLPEVGRSSDVLGDSATSPFNDYISVEMERAEGLGQFSKRGTELQAGFDKDNIGINDWEAEEKRKLDALGLQESNAAEHAKRLEDIESASLKRRNQATEAFGQDRKDLEDAQAAYSVQMGQMAAISMVGSLSDMFGMVAAVGEDATAGQKAAFIAQKALAVAQIIMYAHVGAAMAGSQAGIFGIPMATMILAQGYASAALVGAMAINEYRGGGSSAGGGGGSSYSGAYDDGGFIPYNSYGIVGEYGPEIVHGPANVTSRKESAKQLGGGGGGEYNITLAPQITISTGESSGSGQSDSDNARQLAELVKGKVMMTLQEQVRPNGMLDNWMRSQRG